MGEFFTRVFSADFIPHGHCYLWQSNIVWLHVVSDSIICISYYSIPIALVYLVKKRPELTFNFMFLMFAAFICLCGTTHLMNVITVWNPVYRIDGLIKAITAAVSIVTAFVLWPLIPKALRIPSPKQLQHEVFMREQAQHELQAAHDFLECRVHERTTEIEQQSTELKKVNEALYAEVIERKKSEERQKVLMAELDHRVKNSLSIVLSILNQTFPRATDLNHFRESFTRRLLGLAELHRLLTQNRWERVGFSDLVRLSLQPYAGTSGPIVRVNGSPTVLLDTHTTQSLYMVFHELALNAAKYGSLSVPEGRLDLGWEVLLSNGTHEMNVVWQESGGPRVAPPSARGFGSELIEFSITQELGGNVSIEFLEAGMLCKLRIPLKNIDSQTEVI